MVYWRSIFVISLYVLIVISLDAITMAATPLENTYVNEAWNQSHATKEEKQLFDAYVRYTTQFLYKKVNVGEDYFTFSIEACEKDAQLINDLHIVVTSWWFPIWNYENYYGKYNNMGPVSIEACKELNNDRR